MKHFKKLEIWNVAMDISEAAYRLTSELPIDEKYGLISQIRRSAVSIPSNIAEGSGRSFDKDQSRFIDFAIGSAHELETQLILCNRLNLIENCDKLLDELDRLQKRMYKFRQVLQK